MNDDLIDRVRRALGRTPGDVVPSSPSVHEPTARRVYTDVGLPELFVHAARAGGMAADLVYLEGLAAVVADHLRRSGVHRVAITVSPLMRKIRLADDLMSLGFDVKADEPTAALVTGCDAAVAETGTLAFRRGPPPAWATAAVRVAVLEPRNFVPDLIDFFATEPGDVTLIGGPSVRTFVLH